MNAWLTNLSQVLIIGLMAQIYALVITAVKSGIAKIPMWCVYSRNLKRNHDLNLYNHVDGLLSSRNSVK